MFTPYKHNSCRGKGRLSMPETFYCDFEPASREALPVPYLSAPSAAPIALRPGRQLLVDDALIEFSSCVRRWHQAQPYAGNPVLQPETPHELGNGECPVAAPFNDGVWYDPQDGLYKLFYHAGWFHGTALATSHDGIHWQRPDFGIVGHSNLLLPIRDSYERDGALVWLDQHANTPDERWKMFIYNRHRQGAGAELLASPDGIHWHYRCPSGPCGDNSSFFYDPFQQRWIFSIRVGFPGTGRARAYLARENFFAPPWHEARMAKGAVGDDLTPIAWARSDQHDRCEEATQFQPQLYDLNATPYESVMLGLFAIFHGPENNHCEILGCPKRIDLHPAFSRDGFHWSRCDNRQPLLACSRQRGSWDRGYLHAAGGGCLVYKDKIRFYYGAWSGQSTLGPGQKGHSSRGAFAMYAGAATGFAELRRDGFASMHTDSEALIHTRCLAPGTRPYLFVNAAAQALRVEVLDENNRVVPGYAIADALPFRGDSCAAPIRWHEHQTMPALPHCKLRITIDSGDIYSFWFSEHPDGRSGGYLAAGSPDYGSDRDS